MYEDKIPKWLQILKLIYKILDKMLTLFLIISSLVAVMMVIQITKAPDKIPSFFGYKVLQVMSGSMDDVFSIGDVILIKETKQEDIKKGDIITFKKENIITHRIIEMNKTNDTMYYTTKGDNNNVSDAEKVKYEEIEGKYITKFVGIGYLINFLNTTEGFIILVSLPIIVIAFTIFRELRNKEKKQKRRIRRLDYELQQKNKESIMYDIVIIFYIFYKKYANIF